MAEGPVGGRVEVVEGGEGGVESGVEHFVEEREGEGDRAG